MFTQPNGKPIDPWADHDDWKALLAEADVRDACLHDARHTAATVLLLLNMSQRVVQEFMGWSNSKVAERYMHVTESMRQAGAGRLNDFLWAPK
jgi:integrase